MYQSGEKVICPTREAGACAPTAAPGACKKNRSLSGPSAVRSLSVFQFAYGSLFLALFLAYVGRQPVSLWAAQCPLRDFRNGAQMACVGALVAEPEQALSISAAEGFNVDTVTSCPKNEYPGAGDYDIYQMETRAP